MKKNLLEDPYADLTTEQPNPRSQNLDRLSPVEFVDLCQAEEERVLEALERVRLDLAEMIEELAGRFQRGGRLFYAGAGTSGRLGMLDAVECPPTFGTPPSLVQAILAGGDECLVRSVEGAEDDEAAGIQAVHDRDIREADFVLGIAASSTTPFVRGALSAAAELGAYASLLTCHEDPSPFLANLLHRIVILRTGPEILTGSTRMKAGTATKIFLNRLSTGAMIRIGKVYQNRMVDLYTTCDKLRERAIRTTRFFTKLDRARAVDLLEEAGGSVKVAVAMHHLKLERLEAESRLKSRHGVLWKVLEEKG